MEVNVKTTEDYWTDFWKNHQLPEFHGVEGSSLKNYVQRNFHAFYFKHLKNDSAKSKSIIEIGCGNSIWLTYFNRTFGMQVAGIDYSEFGCQQTKKILDRDGVIGEVTLADLFHPPADLKEKFDAACSFGVIEHFEDTTDVIKRIASFVKPGGLVFTTIPNMVGIPGWIQKILNREVYNIHKPMTLEYLAQQMEKAGLKVITKELLLPVSFGVTLKAKDDEKIKYYLLKKLFLKSLQVMEKVIWLIDDKIIKVPRTEWFCAGMMVAAEKRP